MSENPHHPDPDQPSPDPGGSVSDPDGGANLDDASQDHPPQRTSLSELVPLHVPAWLLAYLFCGVGGVAAWVFWSDTLTGASGTFVFGAVLLLLGGQLLVDGSISIARRFGVPALLIGLTIVAVGTSAPELFFNVIAALDYQTELSLGNVVGSNIANIGLVLGAAALVRPLVVHSRVIVSELPILIFVTAATIVLGLFGSVMWEGELHRGFGRCEGLGMVIAFIALLGLWYHLGKRDVRDPLSQEVAEAMEEDPLRATVATLYVVGGLAALIAGGHFAKTAAVEIAQSFGVSPTMIGLTIVAFATSLPEVVTSIIACRRGHTDLAIGNIIGSNLFNILLVLGVTSTITVVPLTSTDHIWDLAIMGVLTLALLPIAITNQRRITRGEGGFLFVCWIAYILFTVLRERG